MAGLRDVLSVTLFSNSYRILFAAVGKRKEPPAFASGSKVQEVQRDVIAAGEAGPISCKHLPVSLPLSVLGETNDRSITGLRPHPAVRMGLPESGPKDPGARSLIFPVSPRHAVKRRTAKILLAMRDPKKSPPKRA